MKGILTMMMLVSVINVVMAGYLHPQYGFAHRVNDEDNIASLLNTDINGIELDVCRGYSIWNGWNWYVSHNDLGVCNNPSAVTLTDWLKELKNENPSNKPLAMLWLDVKTPGDTSMGELVDDVHNAGLPSNIKILYDLTAFNADSRAGFNRIYYKLNTNEGISFCAGKSCGSDINLIKQIYDYYKSKYFTRGTFNTGDSIDIDEDFIHYANSPLFNDPTDPFRFKAIFTWTNGEQNSMQDHMRPWPDLAYTDGQIIGSWILEWNSPNHHSYIDKFKSAVNNYPLETLATSSINPFTTYQRRSTYIILDTISKDWLDAQSVCAVNYGGRLATLITNKQIQIAHQLRINSEYSNTESLWIGLNNIFTGGEWQWDSEHMCSYTGNSNCNNDAHWNVGQPTDFSGQGCAVLLVDNSYHNSFDDIPCSLSKGYLCDSPNEYILIQQKKTWQNAQDHCRNKYGTNLATVVTDDQISKLMQVIPETETIFWVGLNDRNTNGNWEWASSYSCSYAPNGQCKYDTHWAVNEPNAVNINHCAAFIITIDVELSASACTDVSYFYCDSSIESSIWSPPSKSPSKSPSKLPSKSPSNAPTTKQFSEIRSLVLNGIYDNFLSYLSERNIQPDAAALSVIEYYMNLNIPSLTSALTFYILNVIKGSIEIVYEMVSSNKQALIDAGVAIDESVGTTVTFMDLTFEIVSSGTFITNASSINASSINASTNASSINASTNASSTNASRNSLTNAPSDHSESNEISGSTSDESEEAAHLKPYNVDDIEYNDSNDDNIYKILVVNMDEFTWINISALCVFACLSGVVSVYYYSKYVAK